MRLRDKVAIITGAAGEIGAASAILFAREGARVVASDILDETGNQVVESIGRENGSAIYVYSDIALAQDASEMVEKTYTEFGRVDILFNNAGIFVPKPLLETTEDDLERYLQVILQGAFRLIKHVLPHMIAQRGGLIINTASSAAIVGRPGMPVYGASKGALVALTRGAAVAYGPSNVRVNAIIPGSIWTGMTRATFSLWSNLDDQKRRTKKVIPLRRIGEPEDIANAALFLASDVSKYITGLALTVDGGRTAGIAEAASADNQ